MTTNYLNSSPTPKKSWPKVKLINWPMTCADIKCPWVQRRTSPSMRSHQDNLIWKTGLPLGLQGWVGDKKANPSKNGSGGQWNQVEAWFRVHSLVILKSFLGLVQPLGPCVERKRSPLNKASAGTSLRLQTPAWGGRWRIDGDALQPALGSPPPTLDLRVPVVKWGSPNPLHSRDFCEDCEVIWG